MISFSGLSGSLSNTVFGFSTKGLQVASSTGAENTAENTESARRKPKVDSLLSDAYVPSTSESKSSTNFSGTSNTDASSKVSLDFSKVMKKVGIASSFGVSKSNDSASSIASKMQEIGHDIEKKIYQGIITRTVESKGVKLGSGDVLAFSVDGTGTISINAEASKVAGYVSKPDNPDAVDPGGKYIEDLCGSIAADLNKESTGGSSFGDALLKHYAKEMGYDYDAIKGDASFSISFSFRYNEKTGANEMMNARIVNQMSSDASAKLAQRKAAREEKEALLAAALAAEEAANNTDAAVTESEEISETETAEETEDTSGTIRSGQVSLDEFEQAYQDRYVKVNRIYALFDMNNPPTCPTFKREGDRLVPTDPNLTMEEAIKKADEYNRYARGELFSKEPPEGYEEPQGVGVIKVMYNDYSRDLIAAEAGELNALYSWQHQDINGDAHVAQAYRDRINAESAVLDGWIGELLDKKGLALTEDESLEFDVDLDGRITITGGVDDAEKASAIEAALNEDETLGRELLLNHVRQDMGNRKHSGSDFTHDPVNSRIIANEVLRSETGLTLDDIEFDETTITFKDKNGQVDLTVVSKDYMVWQGLYNSFQWNGEAYESVEALSVSFTYTGTR